MFPLLWKKELFELIFDQSTIQSPKNLIPKHIKFLNMSNWLCLCLWWGALFHGLTLEEEPDYMGSLSITYMNLFFFSNGLMQLVRTQFSFEIFSRILHSYPSILY
jgi:hypothetical protein